MNQVERIECDLCGGSVVPQAKPGRKRDYRAGISFEIPAEFPVPTCESCGEIYLTASEAEALDAAQKPAFLLWQATRVRDLIQKIQSVHPGVTIRELERACGVTGTYSPQILRGRNEIGKTLLNYLEALALYPEEVTRRLRGVSFEEAYLKAYDAGLRMPRRPTFEHQGVERPSYDLSKLELAPPSNDGTDLSKVSA